MWRPRSRPHLRRDHIRTGAHRRLPARRRLRLRHGLGAHSDPSPTERFVIRRRCSSRSTTSRRPTWRSCGSISAYEAECQELVGEYAAATAEPGRRMKDQATGRSRMPQPSRRSDKVHPRAAPLFRSCCLRPLPQVLAPLQSARCARRNQGDRARWHHRPHPQSCRRRGSRLGRPAVRAGSNRQRRSGLMRFLRLIQRPGPHLRRALFARLRWEANRLAILARTCSKQSGSKLVRRSKLEGKLSTSCQIFC